LDPSGCWGHRHDILWQFGPGALAMGAAVGPDSSGKPAYTMLLMQGSPSYTPVFTYTWNQAVADGAGSSSGSSPNTSSGASGSGSPALPLGAGEAGVTITVKLVRIRGHRVTVKVVAAGNTRLRCLLTRARGHFKRARRHLQPRASRPVSAARHIGVADSDSAPTCDVRLSRLGRACCRSGARRARRRGATGRGRGR
jgi:hypothetical protein